MMPTVSRDTAKSFFGSPPEEIALHKAAKAAFDEAGLQNCPRSRRGCGVRRAADKRKQPTRTTARHGTRCRNWFGHRKMWNDFCGGKTSTGERAGSIKADCRELTVSGRFRQSFLLINSLTELFISLDCVCWCDQQVSYRV